VSRRYFAMEGMNYLIKFVSDQILRGLYIRHPPTVVACRHCRTEYGSSPARAVPRGTGSVSAVPVPGSRCDPALFDLEASGRSR